MGADMVKQLYFAAGIVVAEIVLALGMFWVTWKHIL
jgi:hypothetical protein